MNIDATLIDLFNQAYKSPFRCNLKHLSFNGLVDANSIRTTVSNPSIVSEPITLARVVLKSCYDALPTEDTQLFFIANYAYCDDHIIKLSRKIATEYCLTFSDVYVVATNYIFNRKVKSKLDKSCRQLVLNRLNELKYNVWDSVELILANN